MSWIKFYCTALNLFRRPTDYKEIKSVCLSVKWKRSPAHLTPPSVSVQNSVPNETWNKKEYDCSNIRNSFYGFFPRFVMQSYRRLMCNCIKLSLLIYLLCLHLKGNMPLSSREYQLYEYHWIKLLQLTESDHRLMRI